MEKKWIKTFILIIIPLILSSCLIDIIDDDIKTVNAKEIEEIIVGINLSNYPSIMKSTDIPIVGWHGIQEGHINYFRFNEAKEAGININYTHHTHIDSVQKSLDIANQLGIKILIYCPELESDPINTVMRFKDHPANGGYFIKDEPTVSLISTYKTLVNKIESIDDNHFCYINLLSNQHSPKSLEAIDYADYISRYVNEIPLKVLSFDHYPIIGSNLGDIWYENLEIIREEAKKNNIPFWAFALSTAHMGYPIPNLNHLKLQVYSNLAYGAKGIQYFTYWTLLSKRWDFHSGPIDAKGNKTLVYDLIQKMNQKIQNLSFIFLSSEVTNVCHYGNIPRGTTQYTKAPHFIRSINISGGNALLSEMKNDENLFLIVQNTNLNKEIEIDIQTDDKTKIVLESGNIIPANLINEKFKLTPGDIVIFMH
ncbi:hypothetical protein [Proteiniphilum saccharofermentans]|uniref:hypothetical protein n=1 Tax=Proteiniphilum saccharofermentans TaxID=1642647 RepID=UPI0028B0124E|nr:hypothetical protein [Proteiniphilum saccharofermentans]